MRSGGFELSDMAGTDREGAAWIGYRVYIKRRSQDKQLLHMVVFKWADEADSHCGEASVTPETPSQSWTMRRNMSAIAPARHQTTNHNLYTDTNTRTSPPYRRAKISQNWLLLQPHKKTSWPSYQRLQSTQPSLSASSVCLPPCHLRGLKLTQHFYRSWGDNSPYPHSHQVGAFKISKDTAHLLSLRTSRPPSHCQSAKERHTPYLRWLRTAPPLD